MPSLFDCKYCGKPVVVIEICLHGQKLLERKLAHPECHEDAKKIKGRRVGKTPVEMDTAVSSPLWLKMIPFIMAHQEFDAVEMAISLGRNYGSIVGNMKRLENENCIARTPRVRTYDKVGMLKNPDIIDRQLTAVDHGKATVETMVYVWGPRFKDFYDEWCDARCSLLASREEE